MIKGLGKRKPGSGDSPVKSVNNKEGDVILTQDDIGLSNVDNTSDQDKPISDLQQEQFDKKVDKEEGKGLSTNDFTNLYKEKVDEVDSKVAGGTVNKSNASINLVDKDGNIISTLSLGFLTTNISMEYDEATNKIVIKDSDGNIVSSFDANQLVSGLGQAIDLSGTKLRLLDSTNTVISEVTLTINNIKGLLDALADKVDKVDGKQLSTNDYTNADKDKLAEIEEGAQKNVQSDFLDLNPQSNAFIKNKSTTVTVEDSWVHQEGDSQIFEVDYNIHRLLGVFLNGQKLIASQFDERHKGCEILIPLLGKNNIVILYETKVKYENIHGLQFDTTIAAPEIQYVGNQVLNQTKPILQKFRRCLLSDDGIINYYTHKDNTNLKEDSITPSVLDGTDGMVMVDIPRFWYEDKTEGKYRTILFSETPFEGAIEIKQCFRSAYEASLHRPTNKLSSVCNITEDFRGGNNDSSLDNSNEFISQLGKPATRISRINFRIFAQNRGKNWYANEMSIYEVLVWLQVHDIGTRNTQDGLSIGLTTLSSSQLHAYNGYNPLTRCGVTNSLGNNTGELQVTLTDYPEAGETREVTVFSWRGFENFYGHIWEWSDGVNVINNKYYRNPRNRRRISNTGVDGYELIGDRPPNNGYIREMYPGTILPMQVGGSSTTYYCDYFYRSDTADIRGLLLGGSAFYGANAGSFFVYADFAPASTNARIGSRLCFFPE